METRLLSKDLKVTAVGLGCMGFSHGYGAPTDEQEAIKAIRAAYDMGYRFFDTAEIYTGTHPDGSISYNEELVGKALADVRDDVVIATKFGIASHGDTLKVDSSPDTIRKSVEGSLKRLGTNHIDLYYQHRIDPSVTPEAVAQVMQELINEGKITHWGISEANEDYLRRANAVCKVTAVQNRYSMMYREYEKLFPVLEELNVGLVAFSPLANGLLTGKMAKTKFAKDDLRNKMPQFTEEAYEKNQELIHLLEEIAKRHKATPAQISLAWMINKKPYIVPIPGSRHLNRMKDNLDAANIKMTKEEVSQIDAILDEIPMSDVFGGTKTEHK
ncbi:aldo/keto reductase [Lactobacillus sp. LL6]|uniref:aldo/keto reductase n=1 Tax=Lactobacillus sp. LL6 TaxID=2596827 RepID=UPI001186D25B|nr:aldo/keto reductase [Lactobacillus sp. LL6]TSO26387.1 aldo/keto reductase [Lactobacillus sp. LL6]